MEGPRGIKGSYCMNAVCDKRDCKVDCELCGLKDIFCVFQREHNQSCSVCHEKGCRFLNWNSNREAQKGLKMSICMDCVFDGALFAKSFTSFNEQSK